MSKLEFEAEVIPMGPNGAWTCLKVPRDVPAVFGSRARIAVKGTINGFGIRTSIFPMGDGEFFMMVNKRMQKGAGVAKGDKVSLVIELDDAPRVIEVPEELKTALDKDPDATKAFDGMPYSHRKEYTDWIVEAKRQETRDRRVEKALTMIRDRKRLKG